MRAQHPLWSLQVQPAGQDCIPGSWAPTVLLSLTAPADIFSHWWATSALYFHIQCVDSHNGDGQNHLGLTWSLKDAIISLNIIIQFQIKPLFSTCQSERAHVPPSRRITSRRIMLEWERAHGIDFLPPTMHLLWSSDPTKFNKCFRAQLVPAKEAHQL